MSSLSPHVDPQSDSRWGSRPQTGFTLVEILVAFVVAALVLGAIYAIFSNGLRSSLVAQHRRDALLLAESSIDALTGVPVGADDTDDRVGSYERHVQIRERGDLVSPNARIDVLPYEVQVRISWRDGAVPRFVSLSTLWLGPR
jgi:general secretion pathway protein I